MPHLKVVNPKVALDMKFDGALVIGRHIANSLPIPDTEISRRHAQIFPRSGEYFVSDLGSRNGAFVNGEKVKECGLKPGDEIALGTSLLFFDPPSDTPLTDLLSPRGAALWGKTLEPAFEQFQVTTFGRGEMEETLEDWRSHPGSLPLLSLPMTAKFMDYMLRSEEWSSRQDLCQGTLEFLEERIGGERLILMAADSKKHNLQAQGVIHPDDDPEFQIPKDVLRVVMEGERAVFCSDCSGDFRFTRMIRQGEHLVGSFVAAPIFHKDQMYGFLYADYPPGAAFFDYKSLIQTYLTGSIFARCIHWLGVGRNKRAEP